jgi:hypothetical protein
MDSGRDDTPVGEDLEFWSVQTVVPVPPYISADQLQIPRGRRRGLSIRILPRYQQNDHRECQTMSDLLLRGATAAVLSAASLALSPANAHAATYEVRLCSNATSAGFVGRNDNSSALMILAQCPPEGNDPYSGMLVSARPGQFGPAAGQAAAWTVVAPAGTMLRTLSVRRTFAKSDPNYEVAMTTAEGAVLDGCPYLVTCTEESGTRTYGPTLSRSISFRVGCAPAAASCGSSTLPRAWLVINQATATIEDPDPPVVGTPEPVGPWQHTADVAVAANDSSGVRSLGLQEGPRTLASRDETCNFTQLTPCPLSLRRTLSADVVDGIHTITATATDAAGQSRVSDSTTLRVDRQAPAAPIGLTIGAGSDGSFVYTWRNPNQGAAAPITAAHYVVGNLETVVRGPNIERLEAPSGGARVWLEDEAGNSDPANAANAGDGTPITSQSPLLRPSLPSPRLRIVKTTRTKTKLIVRGTIARGARARVTATLSRGKRSMRASVTPRGGKWTIQLRLSTALRRAGSNKLIVRYGGENDLAPASLRKQISVR